MIYYIEIVNIFYVFYFYMSDWVITSVTVKHVERLPYFCSHVFTTYILKTYLLRINMYSRFSSNSEAYASELLENFEGMFSSILDRQ